MPISIKVDMRKKFVDSNVKTTGFCFQFCGLLKISELQISTVRFRPLRKPELYLWILQYNSLSFYHPWLLFTIIVFIFFRISIGYKRKNTFLKRPPIIPFWSASIPASRQPHDYFSLLNLCAVVILCTYSLVTARSSGILKAKQKLGRTFNSDKLGGIAFTKTSKLTMCSA